MLCTRRTFVDVGVAICNISHCSQSEPASPRTHWCLDDMESFILGRVAIQVPAADATIAPFTVEAQPLETLRTVVDTEDVMALTSARYVTAVAAPATQRQHGDPSFMDAFKFDLAVAQTPGSRGNSFSPLTLPEQAPELLQVTRAQTDELCKSSTMQQCCKKHATCFRVALYLMRFVHRGYRAVMLDLQRAASKCGQVQLQTLMNDSDLVTDGDLRFLAKYFAQDLPHGFVVYCPHIRRHAVHFTAWGAMATSNPPQCYEDIPVIFINAKYKLQHRMKLLNKYAKKEAKRVQEMVGIANALPHNMSIFGGSFEERS